MKSSPNTALDFVKEVVEDVVFIAGLAAMAYAALNGTRNSPSPKRDFMRDR